MECLLCGTAWILTYKSGYLNETSTFCPHSVLMSFVWISEQTDIISLHSIIWLVFITERWSVYCAVRTESWTIYIRLAKWNFYILPTQRTYVFCMDLRTNRYYFPIQHYLIGFYKRKMECLLCRTDWILECISGYFSSSLKKVLLVKIVRHQTELEKNCSWIAVTTLKMELHRIALQVEYTAPKWAMFRL